MVRLSYSLVVEVDCMFLDLLGSVHQIQLK